MAMTTSRNQAGTADATDAQTRPEPVSRGDRARQRVLAAALDQLAEQGSAGFTMEAIARRAGASKATLYRRWSSSSALLVDAMAAAFRSFPAPSTGDLRGDLVALLTSAADLLTSERFPRLMAAVIELAERDPALAQLHADLTAQRRRPVLDGLRQGQERGEVAANADLELLVDLLTAPFFYRRLIAHRPIPPTMPRAIVDQILAPLAAGVVDAGRSAPDK
jgi:AcrR family transcriptional regulator